MWSVGDCFNIRKNLNDKMVLTVLFFYVYELTPSARRIHTHSCSHHYSDERRRYNFSGSALKLTFIFGDCRY